MKEKPYAIFDLDGTLIRDTSLIEFYKYFLAEQYPAESEKLTANFLENIQLNLEKGLDRLELNALFYQNHFKHIEISLLKRLGNKWVSKRLQDPDFLNSEVVARLNLHKAKGHNIVIASGSFREIVVPLCQTLDIDEYICAPLEEDDARYTGQLTAEPTIEKGKLNAVVNFLRQRSIDSKHCYAYSDDHSDIPLLSHVAFPYIVKESSDALLRYAASNDWPILNETIGNAHVTSTISMTNASNEPSYKIEESTENNQSDSPIDTQVAIIGAGPTGLTLALCLKRYGIDVDIFEKKSGPNDQSKALAMSPMSQVQLALCLGECPVGSNANKVKAMSIYKNNTDRLCKIKMSNIPIQLNDMLVQTQQQTEQELIDKFEQMGGRVHWNTKVENIEVTGSENTNDTHANNGPSTCYVIETKSSIQDDLFPDSHTKRTYQYLIGCEGKYSLTRKLIDANEHSLDLGMHLALADYEMECHLGQSSAHYFIFEETFFVMVPLGNDLWRLVVKYDGEIPTELDETRVERAIKSYFGNDIRLRNKRWFSQAPLYSMTTDSLSKNRAFIAGDSAHLYSPLGGTGMNTGIVDALNLGWKIAYEILRYSVKDKLLSTYSIERLPSIHANADSTNNITKLITHQNQGDPMANLFLPKLSNRKIWKTALPVKAAGLATSYKEIYETEQGSNAGGDFDLLVINLLLTFQKHIEQSKPSDSASRFKGNAIPFCIFHILNDKKDLDYVLQKSSTLNLQQMIKVVVLTDNEDDIAVRAIADERIVDTLKVDQNFWSRLKTLGSLIVTRPDGFTSFVGETRQIDKMLKEHKKYLLPTNSGKQNRSNKANSIKLEKKQKERVSTAIEEI